MKVETNLTPGDYSFALCKRLDLVFRFIVIKTGVVRMHADRRVNGFVLLSQLNCAFEHAAVRISRSDVQDRRHAGRSCTIDNLFTIGVELWSIDMRVRISKHFICHKKAQNAQTHFCASCAFLWLTLSERHWGCLQ